MPIGYYLQKIDPKTNRIISVLGDFDGNSPEWALLSWEQVLKINRSEGWQIVAREATYVGCQRNCGIISEGNPVKCLCDEKDPLLCSQFRERR